MWSSSKLIGSIFGIFMQSETCLIILPSMLHPILMPYKIKAKGLDVFLIGL